jgi:hypothetical protein
MCVCVCVCVCVCACVYSQRLGAAGQCGTRLWVPPHQTGEPPLTPVPGHLEELLVAHIPWHNKQRRVRGGQPELSHVSVAHSESMMLQGRLCALSLLRSACALPHTDITTNQPNSSVLLERIVEAMPIHCLGHLRDGQGL